MTAALRYEWARLWTIRSTYWLIAITIAFQAVMTGLIAWQLPESGPLSGGEQVVAQLVTVGASTGVPPLFMAYIVGIIGVFSMGHEYRHGMIRATLTAVPVRWHVLVAKCVTVAVTAAGTVAVCLAVSLLNAVIFGVDVELGAPLWELCLGVLLYVVLFAWSGLAFAGLIRNQTAAVALLMLVPSVVESIIRAVVLVIKASSDDPTGRGGFTGVLRFLPYDAGGQMFTRASIDDLLTFFGTEPLSPVDGGMIMVVYVAILIALMSLLFVRRDA